MQMNNIAIEQIRHELTWKLRQKVLYPQKKLYEMEMDEDADGMHFGAFSNDDLVGVISLFKNGDDFQFRKFAVEPSLQNEGIGSTMLQYITAFVIAESGTKLWCNARLAVISFFLKHGFVQTGKLFAKNGFDYEIVEKQLSA